MCRGETTDPGESGPGPGAGGVPPGLEPAEVSAELSAEARQGATSVDPPGTFFVTLRFGRIQLRGTFTTRETGLKPGDWVQARTIRGVEQAQVLSRPRTVPAPPGVNDPEEAQVAGEILGRVAPGEEQAPWGVSGRFTREFEVASGMIAEMGLPMRLTDVETLPRQDKAIFYFLADGRVDFRQLVRNLARTLRLRVEMKQIGVRDEARLKGTCGHCGLDLCCARWLRRMAPVNMKMAKTQKTTLDPDKISGRCGRLLCCLRYEEQVYIDHRNRMPQRNAPVQTPAGPGRVVAHELLSCQVRVALEGGEVKPFALDAIRLLGPEAPESPPPGEPPQAAAEAGEAPDIRPEEPDEWPASPFPEEEPPGPARPESEELAAGPEEGEAPETDAQERPRKRRRRRRKGGRPQADP